MKEKYGHLFEDPSRLPHYDEKGDYWELSRKFNVEENDDVDFYAGRVDENGKLRHPFLERIL